MATHSIELNEEGFYIDEQGGRWKLVPMDTHTATPAIRANLFELALDKAGRWGLKGNRLKAQAFDYLQGYLELVEKIECPWIQKKDTTK